MDEGSQSLREAVRRAFTEPRLPTKMREFYKVSLSGHDATGATTHYYGDEIIPKPASLAIVQLDSGPGFYMLYLDEDGAEMTDTYHDDVNGAFAQAEMEFGVTAHDWTKT